MWKEGINFYEITVNYFKMVKEKISEKCIQ